MIKMTETSEKIGIAFLIIAILGIIISLGGINLQSTFQERVEPSIDSSISALELGISEDTVNYHLVFNNKVNAKTVFVNGIEDPLACHVLDMNTGEISNICVFDGEIPRPNDGKFNVEIVAPKGKLYLKSISYCEDNINDGVRDGILILGEGKDMLWDNLKSLATGDGYSRSDCVIDLEQCNMVCGSGEESYTFTVNSEFPKGSPNAKFDNSPKLTRNADGTVNVKVTINSLYFIETINIGGKTKTCNVDYCTFEAKNLVDLPTYNVLVQLDGASSVDLTVTNTLPPLIKGLGEACELNADCESKHCDILTGVCVECELSSHCDFGSKCVDTKCEISISECTSSSDCKENEECKDEVCKVKETSNVGCYIVNSEDECVPLTKDQCEGISQTFKKLVDCELSITPECKGASVLIEGECQCPVMDAPPYITIKNYSEEDVIEIVEYTTDEGGCFVTGQSAVKCESDADCESEIFNFKCEQIEPYGKICIVRDKPLIDEFECEINQDCIDAGKGNTCSSDRVCVTTPDKPDPETDDYLFVLAIAGVLLFIGTFAVWKKYFK